MDAPGRLTTIPFSHYCGRARWALERAGIAFREDPHAPLVQILVARRRAGGRTVPVWEHGSEVLQESGDILRWADRQLPEDRRLEPQGEAARTEQLPFITLCERTLGPHVRRFAYGYILPDHALLDRYLRPQVPVMEARIWRWTAPLIHSLMRWALRIDEAGIQRSKSRIDDVFEAAEALLADGRPFLAGERFGSSDLTFASLCAPILCPVEDVTLPPLEACPESYRVHVERWRDRPAGRHALRCWREKDREGGR